MVSESLAQYSLEFQQDWHLSRVAANPRRARPEKRAVVWDDLILEHWLHFEVGMEISEGSSHQVV